MSGRRLLAAVAGIMVPFLFLFASYYLPAGEEAETTWLTHPHFIVGAGVILGGLLSGVLQPPARHPSLNALLYSPGLWMALWLSYSAYVEGELLSPADRNPGTVVLYPVLLGWLSCRLGIAFKRVRRHGRHRRHHPHHAHGSGQPGDAAPAGSRHEVAKPSRSPENDNDRETTEGQD
jgi:hypothetical protein